MSFSETVFSTFFSFIFLTLRDSFARHCLLLCATPLAFRGVVAFQRVPAGFWKWYDRKNFTVLFAILRYL